MQALVDRWLRELEVGARSALTLVAYRKDLADFLEFCEAKGINRPKDVDNDVLYRFMASLRGRRLAPATCSRRMAAVRSWRRWLGQHDLAPTLANMPIPKDRTEKLPRVLNEDEVRRLIETPDTATPRGRRDRAILEVLYSTGCRSAELCGLDQGDVDLYGGVCRVLGKGKKERMLPLGKHARRALKVYLADPERPMPERGHSRALFLSGRGNRVQNRLLRRVIPEYARQAKIPGDVGPHTLRHSFATHLVRAGAPIIDVSMLLGHVSLHTTQIYIHLAANEMIDTFDKYHPRAGDPIEQLRRKRRRAEQEERDGGPKDEGGVDPKGDAG